MPPRRRGFVDGLLITLRVSGLGLLRGRRGLLLALLGLLPLIPVVVALFREHADIKGALGFTATVSQSYLRVVNVVVCLFLGCAAIGEEIEGKTLPYLLLRAVPRTAILLGKYLAYVLCASLLVAPCLLACYLGTVLPMGVEALWLDLPYLGAVMLSVLASICAYGSVFLLLSVLMRRPLLAGIVLVFAWEALATLAPLPVADYTILHHVYVLLLHWTQLPAFLDLAAVESPEDFQSAGRALSVLCGITGTCLVLSILRFRSKEYPAS